MSKVAIEVVRESLHFSAAHFTIFSATKRERIHGHNFRLNGIFECEVDSNGLCFDYGDLKQVLQSLCDSLDELFLIPADSPYLDISTQGKSTHVTFNDETISVPTQDIRLLPLRNITVEELANWVALQLANDKNFQSLGISKMTIKVASGSAQWGVVDKDLN